ncbi:MAG: hypothetical protein JNK82_11860 [Myxococcaceae bacterium]|nr:hypothetical protein [Myxococcaceae bacterium]
MIDTHYGKGLAGLLVGGLLALGGLVALFVCLMHVGAENPVTGFGSGVLALGLVGGGSDVIFRTFNGTTAVDAFRATLGLVFSLVLLVAVAIGAVQGALPVAAAGAVIALSALAAWHCARAAGFVGSSAHDAPAA